MGEQAFELHRKPKPSGFWLKVKLETLLTPVGFFVKLRLYPLGWTGEPNFNKQLQKQLIIVGDLLVGVGSIFA